MEQVSTNNQAVQNSNVLANQVVLEATAKQNATVNSSTQAAEQSSPVDRFLKDLPYKIVAPQIWTAIKATAKYVGPAIGSGLVASYKSAATIAMTDVELIAASSAGTVAGASALVLGSGIAGFAAGVAINEGLHAVCPKYFASWNLVPR